MSDEDDDKKCPPCPPAGAPPWMATFADLMALLMCFFVLLLSFSEMDAMKFKRLAGSMAQAFGVQAKLKVLEPPKGTSIIAQEFSPGRPEPTPINEIYQHTDDLTELSLEVEAAEEYEVEAGQEDTRAEMPEQREVVEKVEQMIRETQNDARELAEALREPIARGEVEVETRGREIVVRIKEKGSFRSGSAELSNSYIPLLEEVRNVLSDMSGEIRVQGHTDNIPINTPRFRSNWELSTSRAVSVAHALIEGGVLNPNRVQVSGFADTRPVDTNETPEGRARNRRVEIVVQQGVENDRIKQGLRELKENDPALYRSLELEEEKQSRELFELNDRDIF